MQAIKYTDDGKRYVEIPQDNPISWCVLHKENDDFVNLCNWMKCRDFFNDVVYVANAQKGIVIYQLDFTKMVGKIKADQSLYLGVTKCHPSFPNNVEVLNKFLVEQNVPEISCTPTGNKGEYILCLDPYYLKNTYNISLITLLIRFINLPEALKDLKDLNQTLMPYADHAKLSTIRKKNIWFALPKELDDFYYWLGPNHTNKSKLSTDPIYIHDNGVLNWYSQMEIHDVQTC